MIAFFARDGEHVALEIRDQSADLRVRFRRHFIKQLLDFLKLFFLRCASFRLFRNGRADYAAGDAFVRSLAQRQVGLKLPHFCSSRRLVLLLPAIECIEPVGNCLRERRPARPSIPL